MTGAANPIGSARGAPRLHASELQDELERFLSKHHRSSLVAFYGSGEAGEMTLRHGQRLRIIPTQSELLLREQLPAPGVRAGEHGEFLVYLVDWATELPLDISARLAGGRLLHIAREARLASLFGAYQVSPELVQSALARVLLKHTTPQALPRVTAQVLQRADAYRRLLFAQLGVPMERTATLHSLLGWCAWSSGGQALRALSDADSDWQALRLELRGWLRDQWGPLAHAAWVAWEHDAGWRFAAFSVLVEAWQEASLNQPEVARYGRGLLKGLLSQDPWGELLLEAATHLSDPTTVDAILKPPNDSRPAYSTRELLTRAQALISDQDFTQDVIARSRRLPFGYSARRARLAEALKILHSTNDIAHRQAAIGALHALQAHHDATQKGTDLERANMGLRLASYLVLKVCQPTDSAHKTPVYVEALELAAAYAAEGGYIDSARALLRLPASGPHDTLDEVLDAVLTAADVARDADDARFAAGLPAWIEASRPEVTQIAACAAPDLTSAWTHVFLKEKAHRKLLVVVLRGLSTTEATTLAKSLEEEPDRWQPMSWRPDKYKALLGLPAALMYWPTHPENALAAFLGAAPLGKGPHLQHHTVEAFADQEGNLDTEAVRALQAEDKRLVVVSIPQGQWRAEQMKLLRDLLLVAATTDRATLLVSDRGAIPGDRLKRSRYDAADAGGRWRTRSKRTEHPMHSEVALRTPSGEEVWALWDSAICHGISAEGASEAWGGASLAEVVVPVLWLAPQRLSASLDGGRDTALSTRPSLLPEWWKLHSALATPVEVKPTVTHLVAATTSQVLKPATQAQLLADLESPLVRVLLASKYFQEHVQQNSIKPNVENALLLVRILEGANWSMSRAQFAEQIGKPPHSVQGWLSGMRGVLSREGFSAIETDAQCSFVRLNVEILTQLFDLKEGE